MVRPKKPYRPPTDPPKHGAVKKKSRRGRKGKPKKLEKAPAEQPATTKESDDEQSESDIDMFAQVDDDDPLPPQDARHIPNANLAIASDDDEDDDDDDDASSREKRDASRQVLSQLSDQLLTKPSVETIRRAFDLFSHSVNQMSDDGHRSSDAASVYDGQLAFNATLRLCIRDLPLGLQKLFRLQQEHADSDASRKEAIEKIASSKHWRKLKSRMRTFLCALARVLAMLSGAEPQRQLLGHMTPFLVFYVASSPKSAKLLVHALIRIWSESKGEETRILAYLCLMRLLRLATTASESGDDPLLDQSIKLMYRAFVSCSRQTTADSLPNINFMQHSLVETLSLRPETSYEHAFLFIRQLAVALRVAIVQSSSSAQHKKTASGDALRGVFNWSFLHSAMLWARFLSSNNKSDELRGLCHPLATVLIGAVELEPNSARYLPFRFHCLHALNLLASLRTDDDDDDAPLYVPTLEHVLHILTRSSSLSLLGKKQGDKQQISFRPQNWSTTLKLSDSQLKESSFREAFLDAAYDASMEHLNAVCCTVAFPEMMLVPLAQLRAFLKSPTARQCPPASISLQRIARAIKSNAAWMVERRARDLKSVTPRRRDELQKWQRDLRSASDNRPPFLALYAEWKAKRVDEARKEAFAAQSDVIAGRSGYVKGERPIPRVDWERVREEKAADREEFRGGLYSDDDDDKDSGRQDDEEMDALLTLRK